MAVATGTAIALAAAASAGTAAYQTHSANSTNKRSQDYQHDADVRAQATEDKRLAEESAAESRRQKEETDARVSKETRDRERWTDYLRVNEPMWNAGAGVLQNLYSLAGINGPSQSMPSGGPPPSGPAPGSGSLSVPPGTSFSVSGQRPRTPMPMTAQQPPQGISLSDLMAIATQGKPSMGSTATLGGT